jgi:hypothetical protein
MSRKKCAVVTSLPIVTLVAFAALASAQAEFTLDQSPALSTLQIPSALADRLDPQGSRIIHHKDNVCDVWWLKSLPAVPSTNSEPDLLYGSLRPGSLVGLLQFISPSAEDFRDQKLKPGLYTMRYAQIPQDGNHMGVSEYRDFVLLSPLGTDTQLDKALSFDELVNLSRKAAGSGHPAVISLTPPNPAYKKLPALVQDDQGNCSLQVDLHESPTSGAPLDVKLAILLVTAPKASGGS